MESEESNVIRLGTRGSVLARLQSEQVAAELRRLRPDVRIELVIIKTTGDKITDRPLHDMGGKGLFTRELELALLRGEIDFAVHSYKDVPVTMPLVDVSQLVIAAVPPRADARDVLVSTANVRSIEDLPIDATVGTGSLRRECQLRQHRPDLNIVPLRGNIDTRLRKQREGEMDGVILAAAGLLRAGLFDPETMVPIAIEKMIPAAAQGALALQCRRADERMCDLLKLMDDPITRLCTDLEREVIRRLNADCYSPVGVHAICVINDPDLVKSSLHDSEIELRISIADEKGQNVRNETIRGIKFNRDTGFGPVLDAIHFDLK